MSNVSTSPQTSEGTRRLVQQAVGAPPVSMTVSNAFLPPRLWLHIRLLRLRVLCRLMRVRSVQCRLPRSLSFFSGSNAVSIPSSPSEVSSLPVAFQPKISSVLAPSVLLATLSDVLLQFASSLSPVRPSLSDVTKIELSSTDVASPSRSLLQYLRERLAQCNAKFAKLDDKYFQREEFVISLGARLSDVKFQLAASRLDIDTLRAANDDLLESRGTDREELPTLCTRVLELRSDFQAPRASPYNLADVVHDWVAIKYFCSL